MSARTLIFTGEGKGKTTAAFGMVLRASGHGQRVLVVQFLKSNAATGELMACTNLPGVEVVQMGRGFVPPQGHPAYDSHRETAQEALEFSRKAVMSSDYDLIVLDEVCGAIARELIDEDSVIDMLTLPERRTCIVITGRHATAHLMEHADTVTEMRCLQHGYTQGIAAQKGVEF